MTCLSSPPIAGSSAFIELPAWKKRSIRSLSGQLALLGITLLSSLASAQQRLSLHDAIETGLTSPYAQIADEQVNVDHGLLRQAGLGPNPRLYLQSEDLRPWADNFSFPNSTEDYGYLGQTFELDRKRAKRVALAAANLHRSEAQRDLRRRQLAGTIAASFWTAVSAQKIAELLHQDLSDVDDMVRYHRERVDSGAMRGVDLIRMQIERDRIFLALQAAERESELARVDLFRQIGRPSSSQVQLVGDITAVDSLPPVNVQIALGQRVEVTIAKDDLSAAEADLRLQQAAAIPDVDLLAGYKRNTGFNTGYASVQIPLPFRNRNQGEIERATAQIRLRRAGVEEVQLTVRADIEAASESYRRELDIVQHTLPDMRARARQNLDILTEAYRIGGVDLLRYIDAERTEIDVEVTALRTLSEFHQSIVRLQLATGDQL